MVPMDDQNETRSLVEQLAELRQRLAASEAMCEELQRRVVDIDLARAQLMSIFDSIDEPIYVADPSTYELVYVNEAFRRHWGDGVGKLCYRVLQNADEPCSFCTNDKLLGENVGRAYIWEFCNQAVGRWFRCIDKAIRWPDGRLVRYEMAVDITERKQNEESLRKIHHELEQRVAQRTAELGAVNAAMQKEIDERKDVEESLRHKQRLLRQLLDLHEQERRLVAYEIHDGLAQELTGALLRLQAFPDILHRDADEAWRVFEVGVNLLSESVKEARGLITGLRPPVLDESGIVAAIDYLICENDEQGGPRTEFHHNINIEHDRAAASLEVAVFRIVQEAMANARQHSQSDRVRIELLERDETMRLEVRDWGVGFDPTQVTEHQFGLEGVRQRARLLGGHATVDSAPGRGTCVVVELPLVNDVNDVNDANEYR